MKRLLALLLFAAGVCAQERSAPTWEELDAREVPQWFLDAKFGIFIHWGVYSVPAICDTSTYSEWYQHWLDTNSHGGLVKKFHDKWYGEDFEYREFAEQFRCELWDPAEWARIFKRAGADYIVITSKHHDGFCLWPDQQASEVRGYPWNSVETGPRRDLLGELAEAVRAEGIRFGLYYSFLEWHNPLFARSIPDYVEQQMFPQVKDLIARYQPSVFWPDGEWNHPEATWRGRELLHWLRENAPNSDELVVNDRWGKGCRGENGDYYTTEYGNYGGRKTHLGLKPFEECRGIGHSFAFNRLENYDAYLSRTECVRTLIDLVSRGGKLLLDIGPDADGTIPLIMVDRLLAMGRWLEHNGEAIEGCDRSPFRVTPWGRATTKGDLLYLHIYDWPEDGVLRVPGLASEVAAAWTLREGPERLLSVERGEDGVWSVDLRGRHPDEHASVVALRLRGPLRVDDRILPDPDGTLQLSADLAAIKGSQLRLEQQGNLGFWSDADDQAVWSKVVLQPGVEYAVWIDYAIAKGEEGGVLRMQVGDQMLEKSFPAATAGWQDYRQEEIGRVTLDAPDPVEVTVQAKEIANSALCNLRTIRLVPVR
ncbi:MAG: alpha-L-fucosidase [Planctomycetota bacterium]|nr:alpha-L-fucosidase [Planctomycetota bacterium]